MIACTLRGNICNQAFQIATLIAHAKRNNVEYAIPSVSGSRGQIPLMFPHLKQLNGTESFNNIYREPRFGIYEPIPFSDNTVLRGYWQSFKYFEDYKEEVIKELRLEPEITWYNTVSIHQRRGDYLQFPHKYPQATDKYYGEAISFFKSKGYANFVVFSDDTIYSREYFKKFGEGIKIKMADDLFEQDPIFHLKCMAGMTHNIIVNSTFSLFASWLNRNPDKIVIVPSDQYWFGEPVKDRLSTQDMIPSGYIKIDY